MDREPSVVHHGKRDHLSFKWRGIQHEDRMIITVPYNSHGPFNRLDRNG